MDAAEAKRNLDEVTQEGEKRERGPAKGVKVSDIPTPLLDSIRGGGNEDTRGSGKGKREQAPAFVAKESEDPSTSLDEDAMDASDTLAGKRERTSVGGVMGSDIPSQSIDKKSRLCDLRLAVLVNKEVVKEHAR